MCCICPDCRVAYLLGAHASTATTRFSVFPLFYWWFLLCPAFLQFVHLRKYLHTWSVSGCCGFPQAIYDFCRSRLYRGMCMNYSDVCCTFLCPEIFGYKIECLDHSPSTDCNWHIWSISIDCYFSGWLSIMNKIFIGLHYPPSWLESCTIRKSPLWIIKILAFFEWDIHYSWICGESCERYNDERRLNNTASVWCGRYLCFSCTGHGNKWIINKA